MNYEKLMMEALDGTINPADRAALDAYLAQHPDVRLAFQRLQAVDDALRQAPMASPPHNFAQRTLHRIQAAPHLAPRPIKRRYIAAFAVANWALSALAWSFIYTALFSLALSDSSIQPFVIFARGLTTLAGDVIGTAALTARSLITHPAAQVVMALSAGVVMIWLGALVKVLTPRHQLR